MTKCYYCERYKPENKMRKIVVGRGKRITGRKDGVHFVYSCGCYDKKVTRPTIDYLEGDKIVSRPTLLGSQKSSSSIAEKSGGCS